MSKSYFPKDRMNTHYKPSEIFYLGCRGNILECYPSILLECYFKISDKIYRSSINSEKLAMLLDFTGQLESKMKEFKTEVHKPLNTYYLKDIINDIKKNAEKVYL